MRERERAREREREGRLTTGRFLLLSLSPPSSDTLLPLFLLPPPSRVSHPVREFSLPHSSSSSLSLPHLPYEREKCRFRFGFSVFTITLESPKRYYRWLRSRGKGFLEFAGVKVLRDKIMAPEGSAKRCLLASRHPSREQRFLYHGVSRFGHGSRPSLVCRRWDKADDSRQSFHSFGAA